MRPAKASVLAVADRLVVDLVEADRLLEVLSRAALRRPGGEAQRDEVAELDEGGQEGVEAVVE